MKLDHYTTLYNNFLLLHMICCKRKVLFPLLLLILVNCILLPVGLFTAFYFDLDSNKETKIDTTGIHFLLNNNTHCTKNRDLEITSDKYRFICDPDKRNNLDCYTIQVNDSMYINLEDCFRDDELNNVIEKKNNNNIISIIVVIGILIFMGSLICCGRIACNNYEKIEFEKKNKNREMKNLSKLPLAGAHYYDYYPYPNPHSHSYPSKNPYPDSSTDSSKGKNGKDKDKEQIPKPEPKEVICTHCKNRLLDIESAKLCDKHYFHIDCVQVWIEENACPYCEID